jgi:hypothetical protein
LNGSKKGDSRGVLFLSRTARADEHAIDAVPVHVRNLESKLTTFEHVPVRGTRPSANIANPPSVW